jgi:hypothetical protein
LVNRAIATLVSTREEGIVGDALNDDDKFYRCVSQAPDILNNLAQLCQEGMRERDAALETATCVNDLITVCLC